MRWIQKFYADQMELNGFGRMTFQVEHASDGLPVVHLINSPLTAAVFADIGHTRYAGGKYGDHALEEDRAAGFEPYKPGEIWINFVEAWNQMKDGSIHNGTTQGSCVYQSGMALVSANSLALADDSLIHDMRPYGGLTINQLGPNKLVNHVSYPDFEGEYVSSIAAVSAGAVAHELGHCFTLFHTYLNDETANGNLMGNGFRGFRGNLTPNAAPLEESRLSRPSALTLRINPFFQKAVSFKPSSVAPVVEIQTQSGEMKLDKGRFKLTFRAYQPAGPGIALAVLNNGSGKDGVGVVAYKEFNNVQTDITATLDTTLIVPGRDDTWVLRVYDKSGNFTDKSITLTSPRNGFGPQMFISTVHTSVVTGDSIQFDSTKSNPKGIKVHWAFGDGDSSEATAPIHVYSIPGKFEVKLQGTDDGGNVAEISQFVVVRKK